ncbi:NAD+ synthase [Candidatus Legionella polyplacis]|uniref:Glutamine-dependent NAD(+) synthetase n=1 Tax=Candidatus Legionella polyplacis TaxID=2005262 RepID=A0ABZ2GXS0_9GAMM
MNQIKALISQINPIIGSIYYNTKKIINIIEAKQNYYDIIIFPELAITGYTINELLTKKEFHKHIFDSLNNICTKTKKCYIIIGHPLLRNKKCFNTISIFYKKSCIATYHKQYLNNKISSNETQYFVNGKNKLLTITIKKNSFGICTFDDLKYKKIEQKNIINKVDTLICLNASYFEINKSNHREKLLKKYAKYFKTSIIYINQVGGQDEFIFDGQSIVFNNQGNICTRLPTFKECLQTIIINKKNIKGKIYPSLESNSIIYQALVNGVHDYIKKNNFPGALIGLSGGIDSALTLSIAYDAIGPKYIKTILMPSQYTLKTSLIDARKQSKILGIKHTTIYIKSIFKKFLNIFHRIFKKIEKNIVQENIQSRIRNILMMGISNKTGKLLLNTSNKSEIAVGYSTLYGDMSGGFSVLKDVLKTQIYSLAKYRNNISYVIPNRIIYKKPSAELMYNQYDQDILPQYSTLDCILQQYIEKNKSINEIIKMGFSPIEINYILYLIKRNEYKRKQSPPGIKISTKTFGIDWNIPLTLVK